MSKKKSIILLSIVSVLMAAILVMTFIRFPIGVKDYVGVPGAIDLDYEIEGGVAYTLTLSEDNEVPVTDVDAVIEKLGNRLVKLGYSVYSIKSVKTTDKEVLDYDIRIEIKDTDSAAEDIATVAAYGEIKIYGGDTQDSTALILEDIDVIEKSEYLGEQNGTHYISFVFTEKGQEELLKIMGDTYYLKINCGEEEILNTSINKSDLQASRELSIGSQSSEDYAKRLALKITDGGLVYKYEIDSDLSGMPINSFYGVDIALKCLVAVLTLVIVLVICLCVLYRGLGLVASFSMILFIVFEGWLLIGIPGIVLNLGGVLGILVATVICAFGMLVLSQRVKDEYANSQKTVKAAINKGFKASLVPTINLHVVSGVIALLLVIFTSGAVKGFAITAGVGIGVSLICTLVFTRMFTALILPVVKNKEKFLRFKRAEKTLAEV